MSRHDDTPARLLEESLRFVRRESPDAHRALCAALRGTDIACRIDDDRFGLACDGRDVWVCSAVDRSAVQVTATLDALLDVVDGRRTLLEAVLAGGIEVRARLDGVLALHDGLAAYLHGAATSPSCAPLGARLAAFRVQRRRSEQPLDVQRAFTTQDQHGR